MVVVHCIACYSYSLFVAQYTLVYGLYVARHTLVIH